MKVKKNLNIEDELLQATEERAKSLGLTFTAYIQILVNQDLGRKGIDHPDVGINKRRKKIEEIKEDIDTTLYRSAAKNAMAIMDNF